jgi:hypothetical protein
MNFFSSEDVDLEKSVRDEFRQVHRLAGLTDEKSSLEAELLALKRKKNKIRNARNVNASIFNLSQSAKRKNIDRRVVAISERLDDIEAEFVKNKIQIHQGKEE